MIAFRIAKPRRATDRGFLLCVRSAVVMWEEVAMIKSLKFWHNWFNRAETVPELPAPDSQTAEVRKPPSHIAVRTLIRQKQRQARAAH